MDRYTLQRYPRIGRCPFDISFVLGIEINAADYFHKRDRLIHLGRDIKTKRFQWIKTYLSKRVTTWKSPHHRSPQWPVITNWLCSELTIIQCIQVSRQHITMLMKASEEKDS